MKNRESQKFLNKMSVHIQHCARITSKEEASNYKMTVGKCSQKSLPYTFQIINKHIHMHTV